MGTLPQGGKVRLANTDLSYLEWTAVGEPLVLLHATGMHPWLWHPIVMKLWPKYRIVAPYLCDHRKVDPDQGGVGLVSAGPGYKFADGAASDRKAISGRTFDGGHRGGDSRGELQH